eukprot:CAMPEP_0117678738 /NCGR_PEP_ID=MMETSP0804-20121206/17454_1 /TAXON_ID=1074897 /ORGANISM="Tetraselmis astigmatica, Strain CCMP880" /LENGTH=449 /DNA_ID=CAMNT_0005488139 /DNA_START=274 /DNA_END=1623 /DNA_ORIENTATION=-
MAGSRGDDTVAYGSEKEHAPNCQPALPRWRCINIPGPHLSHSDSKARRRGTSKPCDQRNPASSSSCSSCGAARWDGEDGQLAVRVRAVLQTSSSKQLTSQEVLARMLAESGSPPPGCSDILAMVEAEVKQFREALRRRSGSPAFSLLQSDSQEEERLASSAAAFSNFVLELEEGTQRQEAQGGEPCISGSMAAGGGSEDLVLAAPSAQSELLVQDGGLAEAASRSLLETLMVSRVAERADKILAAVGDRSALRDRHLPGINFCKRLRKWRRLHGRPEPEALFGPPEDCREPNSPRALIGPGAVAVLPLWRPMSAATRAALGTHQATSPAEGEDVVGARERLLKRKARDETLGPWRPPSSAYADIGRHEEEAQPRSLEGQSLSRSRGAPQQEAGSSRGYEGRAPSGGCDAQLSAVANNGARAVLQLSASLGISAEVIQRASARLANLAPN